MSKQTPEAGYGLSSAGAMGTVAAPGFTYRPPSIGVYRPEIGLIGCGGISEYHLRAYRELGLDVVGLCDRHPDRAEKRRLEFYPSATVYPDYRQLLRRDEIEVVDIALHPAQRTEVIEQALLAGKHVLSQKPFVLDLEIGERLAALADNRRLKLAVNQNGRWAPHFSYLTQAVRAGLLGDVATVDCTLQWDHTWTAGTAFDRVHDLVLFDFGIHWFDLAAQLLRGHTPQQVWASARQASGQKMIPPILAHAVIDYPYAQVRLNFNGHVQQGQEDRTVVCGTRGTLRSSGPSLSSQHVVLNTAAGEASPTLEGSWFTSGFQGAMTELLDAIATNREPQHGARDNLQSLALCFAAVASANSGRAVIPGKVRTLSK